MILRLFLGICLISVLKTLFFSDNTLIEYVYLFAPICIEAAWQLPVLRTFRILRHFRQAILFQRFVQAVLAWYCGFAFNWLVFGAQHLPTDFLYAFAAAVVTALLLISWELQQLQFHMHHDQRSILFPSDQLEVGPECNPTSEVWQRFQNYIRSCNTSTSDKSKHLIMSLRPAERHLMAEKLLENVGNNQEKTLAISACVLLEEPELLAAICRKSVEKNSLIQYMMIYDLSVLAPMPPLTEATRQAQRQKIREQRNALLNIRTDTSDSDSISGRNVLDETPSSLTDPLADLTDSSVGAIALASFQAEKVLEMLITIEEILWNNPRMNTIWLLSGGLDDPVRERIWIDSITSMLRQNMPGSSIIPIRQSATAHVI